MADPLWINASGGAPSYTAAELRRAFAALLTPKGTAGTNRFAAVAGVRPGGGVIASLSGSTITVRAHAGVISPDLTTTQGPYVYQLDADATHSLTAAHATLSRTDLVYVQVSDNDEDASGARTAVSGYLAGTAGGGVPTLPARSFELARIAVPNSGGGSPALTERGLYTVASGGILPVRDATDLATLTGYEGQGAYQADTDTLKISDGTAFRVHPSATGAGDVIEKVPASNTDTGTGGAFTTWVIFPNVTVPAWATKARFSVAIVGIFALTADSVNEFRLDVGGVDDDAIPEYTSILNERGALTWHGRITGLSAGSQTVWIETHRTGGTGNVRADVSAHLSVQFFWEP